MTPEIVKRDEFIVVGVRTVMDMSAESTGTLWKDRFLPRHGEIKGADHKYYGVFNVLSSDEKNGRYEYVGGVVGSLEHIPEGMVGWIIPTGTYAEIEARGLQGISQACRELVTEWLPDSGYQKMSSPIFASTSDKQPDSETAVWKVYIPVETPDVLAELEKWLAPDGC